MSVKETLAVPDSKPTASQSDSQTAQEYIAQQLQLEVDAREALPYQFDTCTQPLGPLRQSLFSCLTCNPPSSNPYIPAGICYSCSISCHGEHDLVELFSKRDFECDCGTTRIAASPCALRADGTTGQKGVKGQPARPENKYNQNYCGTFCGCGEEYDPAKEKGTMFQCLGLGHVDAGGCGEDWWHPECLMGIARTVSERIEPPENGEVRPEDAVDETRQEAPLPPGFPAEDDFDHLICHKCIEAQPWLKGYAGSDGFLPPVYFNQSEAASEPRLEASKDITPADEAQVKDTPLPLPTSTTTKRKLEEDEVDDSDAKRVKAKVKPETEQPQPATEGTAKHTQLPPAPSGVFSLFLKDDFRDHLCRCPECFPRLSTFPQLLEEEEAYEPPVSESDAEGAEPAAGGSVGSRSLLDRGEAALSTMDRMKAIEGVMAYNHLKDKVKAFLQPFAESGQAVGAEDIKAYFARLRGDEESIKAAASGANGGDDGDGDGNGREQSGY